MKKRIIGGTYHQAEKAINSIQPNTPKHDEDNRKMVFEKAQKDYLLMQSEVFLKEKIEQEIAGIVSQIKQLESKHITPQQKQTLEHYFRLSLEQKRIGARKTQNESKVTAPIKSPRRGKMKSIVTIAGVAGLVSAVFLGLKNQKGSQNMKTPQLSQAPTSRDVSPKRRYSPEYLSRLWTQR